MRRASIAIGFMFTMVLAVPATAAAFPDEKIVFASSRDGSYDIWSMNPDGSGQTKIAGDPSVGETAPSISHDGSRILFLRGGVDVMVMNVDGTEQRRLAQCYLDPAWSPNDGLIALGSNGGCYDFGLYKMNADGTNQTLITFLNNSWAFSPSWSANGQKLAFGRADFNTDEIDVWTVNADGTSLTQVTKQADPSIADEDPDWSADGSRIAFTRLPCCGGDRDVFTMNPDGSAEAQVSTAGGSEPAWAPGDKKIAFYSRRDGNEEIYTMDPDGSTQTRLTNNAASDIDPDWGVLQGPGYARPKGATPLRAPLAIAYKVCTSPNREHGPPLVAPSCTPPVMQSDYLTVGTGDANGMLPRSEGAVRIDVVPDKLGTAPDETDVKLRLDISDIFTKALADYAGELRTVLTAQATDKNNGPAPGVDATTEKFSIAFTAGCVPTDDTTVGSVCSAATTVNSLVGGTVKAGQRAIWQLDQVKVYDGGSDGVAGTIFGNTLFATEGIFAP